MKAWVLSHVGSRPAVRNDRFVVSGGPGDVQRRVERVDGVLAVRGVARLARVHDGGVVFECEEGVAQAL
jgi:hypothetical protein